MNSGHNMKLFNEQDKNNHPSEECGEEGTAALEVNSGHSKAMSSVMGTKTKMKLSNDKGENNCCPSEHKYLFGTTVDETVVKLTTGPSTGSEAAICKDEGD